MATVLIVDDEPQVRVVIRAWLQKGGYETREATDADAALRLLASSPEVEAVLCDVRMRGRDGMWLVEQIRTRFPTLAVVFATSEDDLPAYSTLQDGVVGYVLKPFNQKQVIALVDAAVRWSRHATARPPGTNRAIDDWLDEP